MNEQLAKLTSILGEIKGRNLFLCIEDLVENGVDLARFSDTDLKPERQNLTQYLAAWFKYIGMSEAQCLRWLLEDYMDELHRISQSSLSRIRHSTTSNIKYIFHSNVKFTCECENNPYKAACARDCILYDEMAEIERSKREAAKVVNYIVNEPVMTEKLKKLQKKEKTRAQLNEAMEVAEKLLKEGMTKVQILAVLHERGYTTSRENKFTYNSFLTCLAQVRAKTDIPPKKKYREQLEEALKIGRLCVEEKGMTSSQVASFLNGRGYKTIVGKDFTVNYLVRNLKGCTTAATQIRAKYSTQFNEAMEVADKLLKEEGMTKVQVVSLLNERGYKTKTGISISYKVFSNEWTLYNKKR